MAIDMITAYRQVCLDMEGLEAYLRVADARLQAAHLAMMKGKAGTMSGMPLDKAIHDYNFAVDDHNETVEALNKVREARRMMEKAIARLSDVERLVLLLHVEQGKTLREVADISNYSYIWIKKAAAKLRAV